jgi:hypothetical protein
MTRDWVFVQTNAEFIVAQNGLQSDHQRIFFKKDTIQTP